MVVDKGQGDEDPHARATPTPSRPTSIEVSRRPRLPARMDCLLEIVTSLEGNQPPTSQKV